DRISASEALRLGLVNRVFRVESLDAAAEAYARELASRSPSAVRLIRRLLYGMDGASFEEAIARGAEVNVIARMTEDTRRGVARFLEQRQRRVRARSGLPGSGGAKTASCIGKFSSSSSARRSA